MKKFGIIGSGIAGIALAIRAAKKGYKVHVFDKNPYPGGKLSQITLQNYRFDAGPSLFTLPHLVEELFELHSKNTRNYFSYQRLPEICNYFWTDGTQLKTYQEIDQTIQELASVLGEEETLLKQYFNRIKQNYEILNPLFIEKSLHKFSTWTSKEALKGYTNIPKLGLFSTMHQFNKKQFKNPKTVQLFNRYATYNGSDPYQTPATLSIIPHLEYHLGAYFPKGGMIEIVNSLVKLAQDVGVEFHLGEEVQKLLIEKNKILGFQTAKNRYEFDQVGSNVDIELFYKKFILANEIPVNYSKLVQEKSSSGIIFYWGINRTFKELGVHNIFFSDNYQQEFTEIFQEKTVALDPTVYVHISSKVEKNDAPENAENWFILVNTPANSGQNWEDFARITRQKVIDKINKILKVNIEDHIEEEDYLDPILIENRTGSTGGALYGNSSNNKFSAFLRHPNFKKSIENIVWVGGSVHPGGGIPLCLSSAKIAADSIKD
jgi:phytoene desaturase